MNLTFKLLPYEVEEILQGCMFMLFPLITGLEGLLDCFHGSRPMLCGILNTDFVYYESILAAMFICVLVSVYVIPCKTEKKNEIFTVNL